MANFRISRCLAIQATNETEAEAFYTGLFGEPVREPELEFRGEQTRLFLETGELTGPILEMIVNDLDQARQELVDKGCEVIRWGGKGQANYIRDPFGIHWNIWQD